MTVPWQSAHTRALGSASTIDSWKTIRLTPYLHQKRGHIVGLLGRQRLIVPPGGEGHDGGDEPECVPKRHGIAAPSCIPSENHEAITSPISPKRVVTMRPTAQLDARLNGCPVSQWG